MEPDYWLERWRAGDVKWHEKEVESRLIDHFSKLTPTTVLVPLCGMSLDMVWLAGRGHQVVGVELSPLACETFFKTNSIPIESKTKSGDFTVYSTKNITIYNGNLFAMDTEVLEKARAVYDRAALIALPPPMRKKYVSFLGDVLKKGTEILLIALEYPQDKAEGPPFSVLRSEIDELYGKKFEIDPLVREGYESQNPKLKGLHITEAVYSLTRNDK